MTESRAATITRLREAHSKGYRTTSDEVWKRDPICSGCGHQWPCDTAEALMLLGNPAPSDVDAPDTRGAREVAEAMRADVHHHVSPVIGWLRWAAHQNSPSFDPLAIEIAADGLPDLSGLPETIEFKTRTLVASTRMLQAAADAADAALGEEPMSVQIERATEQVAARHRAEA